MSEHISWPTLVLKQRGPVDSIEIDNDAIEGPYADGAWQSLIAEFTANWVKKRKFAKTATIWVWGSPSASFHHPGYSFFIAEFGLPKSYFEELERHLVTKLRDKAKFSDSVQPNLRDGWNAFVHVQDGAAWIPYEEGVWSKVGV